MANHSQQFIGPRVLIVLNRIKEQGFPNFVPTSAFLLVYTLVPTHLGFVRGTLKGTNLIIYNADLSDSGDYICHAVNSAGEDMITVTLDVQTPAAIITEDQTHTIVEGEPLEVSISNSC